MCGFAKSRDRYRFELQDMQDMLPRIKAEGVRYVRFTGGEPLMHKQIIELIQTLTDHGIKSSIITNGTTLARKAADLARAGLSQIIVSLDGLEATHDTIRGTPGLFRQGIEGLEACRGHGIMLRVNSVVGPDNFRDMPALQDLFTAMAVDQWEMSSLKLGKALDYKPGDRELIEREIIPAIFERGAAENKLVPFGKIWCGNTDEERDTYFRTGVTPRPGNICRVVDRVRYLDPRNKKLYACSLIPHRSDVEKKYPAIVSVIGGMTTQANDIKAQADYFRTAGPAVCTGCSTTAAGFSDAITENREIKEWAY